jgi:hypothetical protein
MSAFYPSELVLGRGGGGLTGGAARIECETHQKSLPLCGRPHSPIRFDFVLRPGQAMASTTAQAPYGELNKYEANYDGWSRRVRHRSFQL